MRKVTIIGTGNVGSTIAYTLAVSNIVNEVVMIDINKAKAEGEAMDIAQGSPFYSGTQIYAGGYVDAADSDIVIITSGVARKPGQTRLELAQTNVNILRSIAPQITKYAPHALYILVSNPVDVMTYAFHKITDIPERHIIGSGTILDTARLRSKLADLFDISQQNIHAYVMGEHGDSSFVPWSQAKVSSMSLEKYSEVFADFNHRANPLVKADIEEYVRRSGGEVIRKKGATFYAVSVSAVYICKCIFSGVDTAMTLSTMMHGEYGVDDVCLSTLSIVGARGVKARILSDLTPEEEDKLRYSAKCLREVIDQIKF